MNLKRILGYLFVVTAAAGFIFSLVGLIEVWRYRPKLAQIVIGNLTLVDQTLNTTRDGLSVVDHLVQTLTIDVTSLQTTTQAMGLMIHETNPILDSLTSLTSKDLPDAIKSTQTSLDSAQSSAVLIDNVLTALTSIPLLPLTPYKPDVPLHTALAQVSTSLNTITPSLSTITASLAVTKFNLGIVEAEINKISETTLGINTTLGDTQTVLDQYKEVSTQLKTQIEALQLAAPTWINTLTWILTFLLAWFLIVQFGIFAQGLEMIGIALFRNEINNM